VVEVRDLFPKMKVFEQRGTALADRQRIVRVIDLDTLLGSEEGALFVHPGLVKLFVLRIFGPVVGHGVPFEVGTFPTGYPECPDINGTFGCPSDLETRSRTRAEMANKR
jgi:hypothetical protein